MHIEPVPECSDCGFEVCKWLARRDPQAEGCRYMIQQPDDDADDDTRLVVEIVGDMMIAALPPPQGYGIYNDDAKRVAAIADGELAAWEEFKESCKIKKPEQ